MSEEKIKELEDLYNNNYKLYITSEDYVKINYYLGKCVDAKFALYSLGYKLEEDVEKLYFKKNGKIIEYGHYKAIKK